MGAPGSITSGKAFEIISLPPIGEQKHYDEINLRYEIISQLNPLDSSVLSLKVTRYIKVEKGSGQTIIDQVISEAQTLASSFTITKNKIFTPEEELKHIYYIKGEPNEVVKEEIKELKIY